LSPSFYDDHLGLIEKRVVDFLLMLIELSSLGVTAEALRANIDSKSAILLHWSRLTKISNRRGRPPTPTISLRKLVK